MADMIYSASEHTPNLILPQYKLGDRLSVSDFNSAMLKIDSSVTENKTNITDNINKVTEVQAQIKAVEDRVSTLETDLECTQEKVRQHTTEIQDLYQKIADLSSGGVDPAVVTALQNQVNTLQATVNNLSAKVETVEEKANNAYTLAESSSIVSIINYTLNADIQSADITAFRAGSVGILTATITFGTFKNIPSGTTLITLSGIKVPSWFGGKIAHGYRSGGGMINANGEVSYNTSVTTGSSGTDIIMQLFFPIAS